MASAQFLLRYARRRAGLSQRALAEKAGVPQSTVGRIEAGSIDPRSATLSQLLGAAGQTLTAAPALGAGIDRTQIRALLAISPGERARLAVEDARNLQRVPTPHRHPQ